MGNNISDSTINSPELLVFGYIHELKNNFPVIPTDIILLIKIFYYEIIKQNNNYSIHGISTDESNDNKYLSYQTSTGACRQMYTAYLDSQWQFLPVINPNTKHQNKLLYYIHNAYPDNKHNYSLTVASLINSSFANRIVLSSDKRTIWELIPINNKYKSMKYKIKRFISHSESSINLYIGVDSDGRWNKLSSENDAEIYEIVNTNAKASTDGDLYSILYTDNLKYFSYRTSDGYCRQTYDISVQSRFEFIPMNDKKDHYYIRNAYPDERLDQYLTFEANTDTKFVHVFPGNEIKTIWKVVRVNHHVNDNSKAVECKLCAFNMGENNQLTFRGWLSVADDQQWNILVDREMFGKIYQLQPI